ncbi:MAG: hypothetical protein WC261_04450 [Synergistaceae bacterium]|jgi:hypothetical protein
MNQKQAKKIRRETKKLNNAIAVDFKAWVMSLSFWRRLQLSYKIAVGKKW